MAARVDRLQRAVRPHRRDRVVEGRQRHRAPGTRPCEPGDERRLEARGAALDREPAVRERPGQPLGAGVLRVAELRVRVDEADRGPDQGLPGRDRREDGVVVEHWRGMIARAGPAAGAVSMRLT